MLKIKDRVYLEAKKGTFTEAFKRTNDSKAKLFRTSRYCSHDRDVRMLLNDDFVTFLSSRQLCTNVLH